MTDDFIKGAWFAFDEVLDWINTQTEQNIDKAELYKRVMTLRPQALLRECSIEQLCKSAVKIGNDKCQLQ